MKNIYDIIIDDVILSDAFKYITLYNTSNLAPYHGLDHIMRVTQKIYNGIQQSSIDLNLPYYNLILAGMFHDMNHSMGEFDDDINVSRAIESIRAWGKITTIPLSDNGVDIEESVNIIRATQYPYVISNDDLNESQKLIRDCDLLIILDFNWFHNILALDYEMKINDIRKTISGTLVFQENISMQSEWGKKIFNEKRNTYIERFTKYNNLFNKAI